MLQGQDVFAVMDRQKQGDFSIRFGVVSASVLVELPTTMQIIIRLTELKIVLYP